MVFPLIFYHPISEAQYTRTLLVSVWPAVESLWELAGFNLQVQSCFSSTYHLLLWTVSDILYPGKTVHMKHKFVPSDGREALGSLKELSPYEFIQYPHPVSTTLSLTEWGKRAKGQEEIRKQRQLQIYYNENKEKEKDIWTTESIKNLSDPM